MGCSFSSEDEDLADGELSLRHFQLLRSVGRGAFGKVRIVQKRDDKKLYALKYINKEKCIKMKAVHNIIQERKLLEEIKNNFVVNLQYAFQDDENMFMVLDLMLGGDLRYRLDRNGPISEECVKFYVAELALALEYLHQLRIVHRDIKPDNLLLDEHGHIHLTDFNVAVRVKPDRLLTAAAGTRAYMAPEILSQKTEKTGYFTSVDWWSLGIVAFECLFGHRPFRGKTTEELCNSIKSEPLVIPPGKVSPDCASCIQGLLERDISKRLGCGPDGVKKFKEHPFFADIDWEKLAHKEMKPPFVPDNAKVNFDATYELEEMLLEDNPLKAKPRRKKRSNGPRENEELLVEMETKFTPFSAAKRAQELAQKAAEAKHAEHAALASSSTRSSESNVHESPSSEMEGRSRASTEVLDDDDELHNLAQRKEEEKVAGMDQIINDPDPKEAD